MKRKYSFKFHPEYFLFAQGIILMLFTIKILMEWELNSVTIIFKK